MNNDDLNVFVICTIAYALGRRSYMVDLACRALINNVKDIRKDILYNSIEKIADAINKNDAGMVMDIKRWNDVLKVFSEELGKRA